MNAPIHNLENLIKNTGDAHDDSENHFTTRLLLLLESQTIFNEQLRKNCVEQVLKNYFKDGEGKNFMPLFLLNDLLRYWRTLCLNYERDRVQSENWWKKNLNLKFARKLTIYSTVLLLLTNAVTSKEELFQCIDKVPLERLAISLDKINCAELEEPYKIFLDNYENFLAAKSYAELEKTEPTDSEKQKYKEMADFFGDLIYKATMQTASSNLFKYLIA